MKKKRKKARDQSFGTADPKRKGCLNKGEGESIKVPNQVQDHDFDLSQLRRNLKGDLCRGLSIAVGHGAECPQKIWEKMIREGGGEPAS